MNLSDLPKGFEILYVFVGIIGLTLIYAFIQFLIKKNRARFFDRKLQAAWDNVLDQYKSTHLLDEALHFEECEGSNKGDVFVTSLDIHYLYRTRTIIENLKYDDLGVAFEVMKHKNPKKVVIPLDNITRYHQATHEKRSKRLVLRAHMSQDETEYVFCNMGLYKHLKERFPEKESDF